MGIQATRIYRFDASGCNGCDIEILEILGLVSVAELGIEIVVETLIVASLLCVVVIVGLERMWTRLFELIAFITAVMS